MPVLQCLIVEDQKPAQRVLEQYIAQLDHLALSGVCTTAVEATAHLHSDTIDLMFLDLHLPQINGIAFLRGLSNCPKVIVTTAYSEHAVDAFDLDVVDYLLKPFSFERFHRSISRVSGTTHSRPKEKTSPSVFVKVEGDFVRINIDEIIYVSSDGNYINIVSKNARHHISGTLNEWESRLPLPHFVRTHRSFIVNLNQVIRVRRQYVETSIGQTPIGRSYYRNVMTSMSKL